LLLAPWQLWIGNCAEARQARARATSDFCGQVREILKRHGREDDYVEIVGRLAGGGAVGHDLHVRLRREQAAEALAKQDVIVNRVRLRPSA
jgi:hypothetical protein